MRSPVSTAPSEYGSLRPLCEKHKRNTRPLHTNYKLAWSEMSSASGLDPASCAQCRSDKAHPVWDEARHTMLAPAAHGSTTPPHLPYIVIQAQRGVTVLRILSLIQKLLQDSCSASVLQGPAGVRHCPAAALRVRSATQNCCRTAVLQVSCAPLFYWRSAPGQLPQRCPASIGGCPARWALVNVRFALQRERERDRQKDRQNRCAEGVLHALMFSTQGPQGNTLIRSSGDGTPHEIFPLNSVRGVLRLFCPSGASV